jgi:hypothetical protein
MNRDPNSEADISDPPEDPGREQPEQLATERAGPEAVELGRGLPAVNATISLQRRATRCWRSFCQWRDAGAAGLVLHACLDVANTAQTPASIIAAANADAKLPALPRDPPPLPMPEIRRDGSGSIAELPEVRIAVSGAPRSAREFDNRSSARATATRPGAGDARSIAA